MEDSNDRYESFLDYDDWGWPLESEGNPQQQRRTGNNAFPSIYEEAHEMMLISILVYALADLRRLARTLQQPQECTLGPFAPQTTTTTTTTNYDNPYESELAVEDANEDHMDRILRLPISTREIIQLVQQNRDLILQRIGVSVTTLYMNALDRMTSSSSAAAAADASDSVVFVELDDEHSDEEPVYGILLNKHRRQIVVAFRGCTTQKDWTIAANSLLKIRNHGGKKIGVHSGFYNYLHDHMQALSILSRVRQLIDTTCKGYSVYCTGHSLGGALATLMAFEAAVSWEVPGPVSCVSFASPMVGNLAFRKAFESLEDTGRLRCLRVNNSLDLFTKLPDRSSTNFFFPLCCGVTNPVHYVTLSCLFLSFFQTSLYRHVGMGLKMYRHGRYKIKFSKDPDHWLLLLAKDWRKHLQKPLQVAATIPFSCCCFSCCDYGCCCHLEDFGINHQAEEHLVRLQRLKDELNDKYLNDLYDSML